MHWMVFRSSAWFALIFAGFPMTTMMMMIWLGLIPNTVHMVHNKIHDEIKFILLKLLCCALIFVLLYLDNVSGYCLFLLLLLASATLN